MHTQTKISNVTFARAFQLDGLEKELPASIYSVELENDVLDGIFLPEYLRTLALIHLHSTPGSPGLAQTLAVPWEAIQAALLRDRGPALIAPPEPGLEEKLPEPIVRLLMRSDSASKTTGRDTNSHLAKRTFSHANAEH